MANEYSPKQRKRIIEAFLKSLELGATFDDACKAAGINRTTIWLWRKADPELDNKVKEVRNARTQVMEDALFQSGLGGNVTAQIFWLKNRGEGEWKDRHEIDHKIESDLNEEERNELINLTKEAIRRLEDMPEDLKKDS